MLGDFNLTEELIDRTSMHLDDIPAIDTLRNLHQCLGLEDSWRHAFPHDRCFTFRTTNNGQAIKSHLDRIYTSKEATKATYDWKFTPMSVPTDHWMVSIKYAPSHAPFIGKGRWTMNISAIKDKPLINRVIDCGIELQAALENMSNEQMPSNPHAPQILWAAFKKDVVKMTKKHCSESKGKLTKTINKIENDLKTLARIPEIDTDNNTRIDEVYLANKLANLKHIKVRDKRDDLRAVIMNHGKVLGGV